MVRLQAGAEKSKHGKSGYPYGGQYLKRTKIHERTDGALPQSEAPCRGIA